MILSRFTDLIRSDSTSTSGWWFVGDFPNITASWSSSASLGPSRITFQVSNEDGFQSAMPITTDNTNASVLTGINAIGFPTGSASLFTQGERYRWARASVAPANHSVASVLTVRLTGWGL